MQHSVDSLTRAAQAAQEGLQLDQAADARGFCEPRPPPQSPKGPDRAVGQQSLGLHRHSWLGMASLFKPSGGARELRRKCIHFSPFVEPLPKWTKQGKGSCFGLFPAIAGASYLPLLNCAAVFLYKMRSRVPTSQIHESCEDKRQEVDRSVGLHLLCKAGSLGVGLFLMDVPQKQCTQACTMSTQILVSRGILADSRARAGEV